MRLGEVDPHELRLVPIVGSPISGVVAPIIYNRLFDAYGIAALAMPILIEKGELRQFLESALLLGVPGFVVTAPLKPLIVPLLDEVEPRARAFSSVNAVRIREGSTSGRGFDGLGAIRALEARGAVIAGARVAILGAGGVAGVMAAEFLGRGASAVTILSRNRLAGEAVVLTARDHGMIATADELSQRSLARAADDSDIMVQATTLGMATNPSAWRDLTFLEKLREGSWVVEAVTNPPRTPFVIAAESRGLNVVQGVDMLSEQVPPLFEFLLDVTVPDGSADAARRFFRDYVAKRRTREEGAFRV